MRGRGFRGSEKMKAVLKYPGAKNRYGWVRANRLGNLDLGAGSQTPQSAMTLNEELLKLRQQVKELEVKR